MLALLARVRRPPGGHFLFGLRHTSTWVLVAVVVLVVVVALWMNRRGH